MIGFLNTTWCILRDPQAFFESIRDEGWWPPYRYFLIIAVSLATLSPLAWALGIDGGSPVNTSLTAQRDTYHWWQETLRPQMGALSLPIAMLVLLVAMHIVLVIFTPILHLVFRALGGQGPVLNSWKAICYGLAPTIVLGFLPILGLLTGVYATLIQLSIGPAALYRLRDGRAYLLLIVVLSIAIAMFWEGAAP